jgi:hypothetical protein
VSASLAGRERSQIDHCHVEAVSDGERREGLRRSAIAARTDEPNPTIAGSLPKMPMTDEVLSQLQSEICGDPTASCKTSFKFPASYLPLVIADTPPVANRDYQSKSFYVIVLKEIDGRGCQLFRRPSAPPRRNSSLNGRSSRRDMNATEGARAWTWSHRTTMFWRPNATL